MRLSTKGRYAVTAMVDISRHGGDRPISLGAIAARQEISLSYLEQLFAKLGRHGLVRSVRGPGGGFHLAKPAAEIMIADIVRAAEEEIKTTNCSGDPSNGCKQDHSRCLTHDLWEELGGVIQNYLASVSLAMVADGQLQSAHACGAKREFDFITQPGVAAVAHG